VVDIACINTTLIAAVKLTTNLKYVSKLKVTIRDAIKFDSVPGFFSNLELEAPTIVFV